VNQQRSESSERRRREIVEFEVVIEIPKGQRNKYEMDQRSAGHQDG
jgi:inorganic pyrophosphatase